MAKILVVGSQKNHPAAEFQTSCKGIGKALAEKGHIIVAAGCGNEDAEKWVLDGAEAVSNNGHCRVIPFAPAISGTQDLIISIDAPAKWPRLKFLKPFKSKGEWAVGLTVALTKCDALLLIGGGVLTANLAALAAELEIPFFAVAGLGGAAKEVAEREDSKHRSMEMPDELRDAAPGPSDFGTRVVSAVDFLRKHQTRRKDLRNALWTLLVALLTMCSLLVFLNRSDLTSPELRLVYATCLGTIAGVILFYVLRQARRRGRMDPAALVWRLNRGLLFGVLYAFFSFEIAETYYVNLKSLTEPQMDSLSRKMGLLGIGVGFFLGPASKRAIEELRRASSMGG
jgi:hypothetical protein